MIAARIAAAYEKDVGGSEAAEKVADAARQAADAAWKKLGKSAR